MCIVESPEFARSQRLSSLLRFLVEETLAGRAERLGGYRVGLGLAGMKSP